MKSPTFQIRSATRDDVHDILRLLRGIAEFEDLTHQLEATPERLEAALFQPNPVAFALVAEDKADGVVGYAIYFHNFSTFLAKPGIYLEDLYVEPTHRGRGIGKALFLKVAAIAQREGCGRMEWMALDWNSGALDFYKAHGAEQLPEWRLHRFSESTLQAYREPT